MKGRIVRHGEQSEGGKLPLLGKIKCGKKKADGKPTSLDHFIADGKYANVFHEAFGNAPTVIPIIFISDDDAYSCNERYECRDSQGRLAGYGDGETYYLYNQEEEEYEEVDRNDRSRMAKAGKWDVILTIKFVIPKIRNVFGVWQFSTKGTNSSIPAIRDTFDAVKDTANTVRNIPFDLRVDKVKSQKPGSKSVFPVITLVPNLSKENMENLANYLQRGHDIKRLGKLTNDVIERIVTGEDDTKKIEQ